MSSERDKTQAPSIDLALALRADATGIEAKARFGMVDKLARVLRPGTYREQEAFDTINAEIRRKQLQNTPLSDLEAAVLVAALEPVLRKTANVRKIISFALEEAPDLKQILDQNNAPQLPPGTPAEQAEQDDEEYFYDRLWADAETVTVERMQRIYARVLARKLTHPGAFSLRTLDTLRRLEAANLRLFELMLPFRITEGLMPAANSFGEEVYERTLPALREFEEAGLIGGGTLVYREREFSIGPYVFRSSAKPDDGVYLWVTNLTRAGVELSRLIDVKVKPGHVRRLGNFFFKAYPDLTWEIAGDGKPQPWTGEVPPDLPG